MAAETAARQRWLILVYSVPRRPSAKRVYVWRKLQRLGAVSPRDGVWVLPATARTREHFRWLSAEIAEMGGSPMLWEGEVECPGHHARLVAELQRPVEAEYRRILDALRRGSADRAALSRRFQQAQGRDYFHSGLGREARAALIGAKRGRQE
ncbi:MAG: ChrB protein [Planctomycetes bacterium]|nr:ChrB protein [Planctomycetota bacterium]